MILHGFVLYRADRSRARMWQFGFGGPDMERLVAGRERIYLDRFWNEFALHPERFDEARRQESIVASVRRVFAVGIDWGVAFGAGVDADVSAANPPLRQ
jgi:hypothetical protein